MAWEYDDESCYTCGVNFGVPKGYKEHRKDDKLVFYCPNGHGQSYQESTSVRLAREKALLERQLLEQKSETLQSNLYIARLEKKLSRRGKK